MTLMLNGELVTGNRLKVTASLKIESEDMSGQTSGTEKAHKGFKPKTLAVAMMISYKNKTDLATLMRLAESTEGGGQRTTFRIVNDTAEAFGIRQVEFTDGVTAREDDSLAQWIISFTLSEKLSNPEKVEGRRAGNPVATQSAPGVGVAGTGTGADGSSTAPQELTGFEALLKKVDTYLAPTP